MGKYKTVSGLYDEGGKKTTYNSTDFFVRTENGDVKFTTLKLARETAINSNKAMGKVVAWTVKKQINKMFNGKNEKISENIFEIEDSISTYDLILKYNGDVSYFYKTKK